MAETIIAMQTVTEIVKEHREAMKIQRKLLKDPKEARKFLIRAGILNKNGKGSGNGIRH
jgi:putative ubiquitin-RnfH superfamily antitoxin RatB of RatAB toxin-antitoxin module